MDRWWLALLLVAFAPALLAMAEVWSSVPYYTHGFLVPLVAGAAAWADRERLPPAGKHRAGLALLLAALVLYGVGAAAGSVTLQGLAFVGALAGFTGYRLGAGGLRVLAFPLVFLLFAVPLPQPVLTPAILGLQLLVSQVAVAAVGALGIPVYRIGNVLELPGGEQLFVAEACSGITSIVTLLPIAALVAWYTEKTWGRRLAVLLAALPLALLANFVRVVATVWGGYRWGVAAVTDGPVHEWAGLLVLAAASGGLLLVGPLLRRLQRSPA